MIGVTVKDLMNGQKQRRKDKEQQEQEKAALQAAKARFKRKPYYCTVCITGRGKSGDMAD